MKKEFVFVDQECIKKYYENIEKVHGILKNDCGDWQKRYYEHCKKIIDKKDNIIEFLEKSHEWEPFTKNVTISSIENLFIDLRYKGQTVGKLTNENNSIIFSTKEKNETNYRDFGCEVIVDKELWNGGENSRKFRKYFKDKLPERKNKSKGNEEHRIESLIIDYLDGKKRKDDGNKLINNLVPIKIFNKVRFALNTPIGASKDIKGCKTGGGGIDIFARYGRNLTIIEVKDKNESIEPPQKAMNQAISYAVFIRELLRAEQKRDNTWWKLFGYTRELPKILHLNVAIAMPFADKENNNGENVYFKNNNKPIQLKIKDESGDFYDILELHYIYYKEIDGKILEIETSL